MNIDEAMNVVAEAMFKGKIYDLNKAMVAPLKKAYGVEDLIFWTDQSNWFYCDFTFPKYKTVWKSDYTIDAFHDLESRLKSLQKGDGTVIFQGQIIKNLDNLKEEILVRKLAGMME